MKEIAEDEDILPATPNKTQNEDDFRSVDNKYKKSIELALIASSSLNGKFQVVCTDSFEKNSHVAFLLHQFWHKVMKIGRNALSLMW